MDDWNMWRMPLQLWDEWAVTLACTLTAFCCFLHLNSMGKPFLHRIVEKILTALVGFGAFGVAVAPFCHIFSLPSSFELALHGGVALFAVFVTRAHWMELPLLDRRRNRHRVDIPVQSNRRGVPVEEEEERACYH